MKKNKIILIISVIFIVVLLAIFLGEMFMTPKASPYDVLVENGYILEREYKVAESDDEILLSNYDFKRYSKDDIAVYVFDYKEYEQAKKGILESYNQEKSSNIESYLRKRMNYVLKKRCDSYVCDYQIAYNNYLISALEEVENKSEIESLFKEMIGSRLKFK